MFFSFVLAQFALGIWYIISFVLASGSYVPGVWVLLRSTEIEFSGDVYFRWCNALYKSGYMFFVGFGRIAHIFYVAADSIPEALLLHSA